jgi:hypothetical protein
MIYQNAKVHFAFLPSFILNVLFPSTSFWSPFSLLPSFRPGSVEKKMARKGKGNMQNPLNTFYQNDRPLYELEISGDQLKSELRSQCFYDAVKAPCVSPFQAWPGIMLPPTNQCHHHFPSRAIQTEMTVRWLLWLLLCATNE